ncbi:MAG: chemotaxis-specific protein-glutamate methyltransferase CheB [Myxococcota bacterium]
MTRDPIRVLVIDDSAFSRQAISRMLSVSPLVEVVGVARDGEEALQKTFALSPDLITLDLEMPKMNGFTFLRLVMSRQPTPVLVISGRMREDDVWKALELGAVDFITKPTPRAAPVLASIERELIRKVHSIRDLRIDRVRDRSQTARFRARPPDPLRLPGVVAIGSSTGGPAALMEIFGSFTSQPETTFLVAQHMPKGFTQGFAERLNRLTVMEAREASDGEPLAPGTVLIAPGGCHLEIESGAYGPRTRLSEPGLSDKYTPSVDRLFETAAKSFGRDLLGVVLTGMGDDGRRGAASVAENGGRVIAESEETAVIFGMPRQAIREGVVEAVLPLPDIAASLGGNGLGAATRVSSPTQPFVPAGGADERE